MRPRPRSGDAARRGWAFASAAVLLLAPAAGRSEAPSVWQARLGASFGIGAGLGTNASLGPRLGRHVLAELTLNHLDWRLPLVRGGTGHGQTIFVGIGGRFLLLSGAFTPYLAVRAGARSYTWDAAGSPSTPLLGVGAGAAAGLEGRLDARVRAYAEIGGEAMLPAPGASNGRFGLVSVGVALSL